MNILEALILGIIQGLAEFLPISSSGHLVLFQKIFGINEPMMSFNVLLHVGTLIPVLIVYRKDIWKLIRNPFQKMTFLLVVGTIPAVIASLCFGDIIDSLFAGGIFLALAFFATGILLLIADSINNGYKSEKEITYLDALLIGIVQAIAITPGISRSGSTITCSLGRKINRKSAAKFSFLLSIPAILGSLVLEFYKFFKYGENLGNLELLPTLFGFLAAMLTGYLAITFMIKLIEKSRLKIFSFYVITLGIVLVVLEIFFNISLV